MERPGTQPIPGVTARTRRGIIHRGIGTGQKGEGQGREGPRPPIFRGTHGAEAEGVGGGIGSQSRSRFGGRGGAYDGRPQGWGWPGGWGRGRLEKGVASGSVSMQLMPPHLLNFIEVVVFVVMFVFLFFSVGLLNEWRFFWNRAPQGGSWGPYFSPIFPHHSAPWHRQGARGTDGHGRGLAHRRGLRCHWVDPYPNGEDATSVTKHEGGEHVRPGLQGQTPGSRNWGINGFRENDREDRKKPHEKSIKRHVCLVLIITNTFLKYLIFM